MGTAIGESNAKYAVVGWMEEMAGHPMSFRHPGGRQYAVERANRLAVSWLNARRRHYRIVLRQIGGSLGLQVIAGSALLALGGVLVVSGQLTLGQLVASELIVTAIVTSVAKLGKQLEKLYDMLAAVDKVGTLFDLPVEREDGISAGEASGPAALEVRDVSFRFDNRPVLENFTLHVAPRERVLLEGPPGAGKSTVLDLLLGLRSPDSGFIALDGHDIRDLPLDELRQQVIGLRDVEVFEGTVLDNMRVNAPWASRADAEAALEWVGILDVIRALPEGLNTRLSTVGRPLSDSQMAGLALARALVAQPRLLLIDDRALNPFEPSARKHVLNTIFASGAPWTIVAVSELPTLRSHCTRVANLEQKAPPTPPTPPTEEAPE